MIERGNAYLAMKVATRLYDKPLDALGADELSRVNAVVVRQREIETLIATTPEAASVMLPEQSIEANLREIRGRYASDEDYRADLDRVGLDATSMRLAVERDMVVEAVLDKVSARAATVSDTDVEIFWFLHRDRFRRAETRVLRHILVTFDGEDNERCAARDKINAIRARLLKDPARFGEQALKHSECPTAMNGGLLGTVPRGRLYPQLDNAAFALAPGALSPPVETEIGYHLIHCEAINTERPSRLDEARQTIREHLERHRRGACQKSWIKALRREARAA